MIIRRWSVSMTRWCWKRNVSDQGVVATLRNELEPGQAIRLRLERGRLHVHGAYPRTADNWMSFDIERPSITVDPARHVHGQAISLTQPRQAALQTSKRSARESSLAVLFRIAYPVVTGERRPVSYYQVTRRKDDG